MFNRAASIGRGPSSGSESTSGLDGAGSGSKEAEALLREPHTGRDRAGELSAVRLVEEAAGIKLRLGDRTDEAAGSDRAPVSTPAAAGR